MPVTDLLQILLYLGLLLALTVPLGMYLVRIFDGRANWLRPVENGFYRLAGIDPAREQNWSSYALALLAVNALGIVVLFTILKTQLWLPLNPQALPNLSWHLAFNTAVSFVTNTNWQSYGGESTMSYLAQMSGLAVQNFLSAATGIAVAVAVTRALARKQVSGIGNFYVDITRVTLYLLLPLSFLMALFLVWQGIPQNFSHYLDATTLEGAHQTIAQGPVASQVAIKQLGTNGGGFFNANAAHPYENPTALANLVEMLATFSIPAALVWMFGQMVGDRRQGWAIYGAMMLLFVIGVGVVYWAESHGNPIHAALPVDAAAGNMEGKETRFGIVNSALFAVITTAASCGAVNAMHDSFTPLGGIVPMFNMMIGEVTFGGVGAGLYGMLVYVLLTVFIAGLMVGRTPEYLGKKIESGEIKLLVIAMLTIPIGVLVIGGIALVLPEGRAGIQDAGPHGLSEILYAYTSATANNGSAFAGLTANSPLHNVLLALSMLIGRFAYIVPLLAVAGRLAAKKSTPASAGTFPTHTPLFVGLLIGVIVIVGGLTFFPTLALGPIVEQLSMLAGQTY